MTIFYLFITKKKIFKRDGLNTKESQNYFKEKTSTSEYYYAGF